MTYLSSLQNPRIKALRALRHRKEREQTGLFFIEGAQLVCAALEHQAAIETLLVAPEALTSAVARRIAAQWHGATLEVSAAVLRSLAEREDVQGIGALVRQRWSRLDQCHPRERCWIALDGVQYPGNLGTILRTCDAVGAAVVILLGSCADPYDPLAVRASTGAIFAQHLVRATAQQFAAWKHSRQVMMVGTAPAAPTDYRAWPYQLPLVLAMGSEGHGLSTELRHLCDALVSIPMAGRSDSLNLAVATGVMLYEVFGRQQPVQARANL